MKADLSLVKNFPFANFETKSNFRELKPENRDGQDLYQLRT